MDDDSVAAFSNALRRLAVAGEGGGAIVLPDRVVRGICSPELCFFNVRVLHVLSPRKNTGKLVRIFLGIMNPIQMSKL